MANATQIQYQALKLSKYIRSFEAAFQDLKRSKAYYKENEPALAKYFLEDIRQLPDASPRHEIHAHLWLKTCKRFPFPIIYHKPYEEEIIYVIAIAHHKRNPDFRVKRINTD